VNGFIVVELMSSDLRKPIERRGASLIKVADGLLQESNSPLFVEAGQFRDDTYSLRLSGLGRKKVLKFPKDLVDDSVDGKSDEESLRLLRHAVRDRLAKSESSG
jgi:hypothetical protein